MGEVLTLPEIEARHRELGLWSAAILFMSDGLPDGIDGYLL